MTRPLIEQVLQILAEDGSVDREIVLTESGLDIGRSASGLRCPDERELAECHARVLGREGAFEIADSGEGSGVWLRVNSSDGRALRSGDQIWLGSQILIVRGRGTSGRSTITARTDGFKGIIRFRLLDSSSAGAPIWSWMRMIPCCPGGTRSSCSRTAVWSSTTAVLATGPS